MTRALLVMIALLAPAAARAGETACWFEHGVVVVAASVAGVSGDYILDTGTAQTQLHETRAQGAGFADTALRGAVRVAGVTLADRPIAVVDLDARAWALPTPIAGVLGADLLGGYVLDISFAPCRVGLYVAGQAPPFRSRRRLPMAWRGGLPSIQAAVSDGVSDLSGEVVVATGADLPVRLTETLASVPGATRPDELFPNGSLRARLRALSLEGDDLTENLRAGLLRAAQTAPGSLGAIGAPVLARHRLRFDFPAGELLLAPAR